MGSNDFPGNFNSKQMFVVGFGGKCNGQNLLYDINAKERNLL